ncbi:GntR family transcriptional regulator [Pseudorhodobacter sp. E13]|uniref:GntR family transcriptional regulator n=1 Tax=Pseudorhodobacter sp. E13 TaxID=2487931 RepID=UPI000F8E69FD|nr:GntR family transcriptional regulator [Pseudorhodobacter sp. E13]RUS60670.1 GntR family transcriptional regulator [Pseudorhodobacter sp. E13]
MTAPNAPTPNLPAHEIVYRQIREMVLFGELAPGQPVTIQGLVAQLGTGMTPVREAIRRLTAEGALEFKGNRRVCVPDLTAQHLHELAFARVALEPHLAELAIKQATPADIDALEATDARVNAAISAGDIRSYLEQNYLFHTALYALSGADILCPMVQGLWLRVGPSLRIVCGRYGTLNLPDKHAEAIAALRAGRAADLSAAIRDDIVQGQDQIAAALAEAGGDSLA